jgi:hypothetical protein
MWVAAAWRERQGSMSVRDNLFVAGTVAMEAIGDLIFTDDTDAARNAVPVDMVSRKANAMATQSQRQPNRK